MSNKPRCTNRWWFGHSAIKLPGSLFSWFPSIWWTSAYSKPQNTHGAAATRWGLRMMFAYSAHALHCHFGSLSFGLPQWVQSPLECRRNPACLSDSRFWSRWASFHFARYMRLHDRHLGARPSLLERRRENEEYGRSSLQLQHSLLADLAASVILNMSILLIRGLAALADVASIARAFLCPLYHSAGTFRARKLG
jgi:hypothetical protein